MRFLGVGDCADLAALYLRLAKMGTRSRSSSAILYARTHSLAS